MSPPILSVRDLKVHFPLRVRGGLFGHPVTVKAIDGVDLDVSPGETLGLVGESGCGKSTLGRAILQLIPPSSGRVLWLGRDLTAIDDEALRQCRREMQIVFQDPLAALDPRMTAHDIIAEPLVTFEPKLTRAQVRARVAEAMARVGLLPHHINRYPHEFSGGQCQRIGIARAMILAPKLLICDEPVSALDVSIQAQIINLLARLQRETGMAMIFISHNLSVVRQICRRIAVLYLGRVVEISTSEDLFREPRHPYTQALISAVPIPDPAIERARARVVLSGELPSPLNPPSGCAFRTRCPRVSERCAAERPEFETDRGGHAVACHNWRTPR
jgi:oligopeptide transport system ATP-binding protein